VIQGTTFPARGSGSALQSDHCSNSEIIIAQHETEVPWSRATYLDSLGQALD
jgi:hypothetical protein